MVRNIRSIAGIIYRYKSKMCAMMENQAYRHSIQRIEGMLMKSVRIILAVIVIILAIYGLVTNSFEIIPYLIFILGSISFLRGISEIYLKRIPYGIIFILASGYMFFVLFQIIHQ
jgi:hypothetical protein